MKVRQISEMTAGQEQAIERTILGRHFKKSTGNFPVIEEIENRKSADEQSSSTYRCE